MQGGVTMTKERADGYIKLAELAQKRFDGRRQDEWKVTLAVWAVLVAAIAYPGRAKIPVWLAPVVVIAYAVLWVWPLWRAYANNRTLIDYYTFEAEEMLRNPEHTPPPHPGKLEKKGWYLRFGFLFDTWSWFHIATTAIIAAAFVLTSS
jgi:hypothetical protein